MMCTTTSTQEQLLCVSLQIAREGRKMEKKSWAQEKKRMPYLFPAALPLSRMQTDLFTTNTFFVPLHHSAISLLLISLGSSDLKRFRIPRNVIGERAEVSALFLHPSPPCTPAYSYGCFSFKNSDDRTVIGDRGRKRIETKVFLVLFSLEIP